MKIRIDKLLVEKKITQTLAKARAIILSNNVLVNNEPVVKAGFLVNKDDDIKIRYKNVRFVSRGGYKLEKAIKNFNIDVKDKICLDIGSSTGGFTDCLLQNEAKLIYAIDVGTNQLEWKLRINPKVISYEGINFRYITPKIFKNIIDFACCDVSFISLDKIIKPLSNILDINKEAVLLIKPQFETTRKNINKGRGRVEDKDIHFIVIKKVINLVMENNFSFIKLDYSPIVGKKLFNIEFICFIKKTNKPINYTSDDTIINIINESWKKLKK